MGHKEPKVNDDKGPKGGKEVVRKGKIPTHAGVSEGKLPDSRGKAFKVPGSLVSFTCK